MMADQPSVEERDGWFKNNCSIHMICLTYRSLERMAPKQEQTKPSTANYAGTAFTLIVN